MTLNIKEKNTKRLQRVEIQNTKKKKYDKMA